jgi:hypothetical protein
MPAASHIARFVDAFRMPPDSAMYTLATSAAPACTTTAHSAGSHSDSSTVHTEENETTRVRFKFGP